MARPPDPPKSSWRDIQQANRRLKPAKVSRRPWLLFLFRGTLALLVLGGISSVVLGMVYIFNQLPQRAPAGLKVENELVFKTNGVLREDWFRSRFGDLLQTEVREINVSDLKTRLEQEGQVASATVTVNLPSRLVILLAEREPILRVRVRSAGGPGQVLLVARDGTLYAGEGYPPDTLRRLPGLAGLRLRETPDGYARIESIESVAHLLDVAREQLPSVYRHWKVVDLSDWTPDRSYRASLVRVRSAHIEEIVFSTEGIEEQIEQLAGILEHTQRYQMGQPSFIDLSYGEEAVIRYK